MFPEIDSFPLFHGSHERWNNLYEVAPNLQTAHKDTFRNRGVPKPLPEWMWLALCAAFADPTRREVLRGLILNLLKEDLIYILTPQPEEEQP